MTQRSRRPSAPAFTLVEALVVVAVIALLVGMLVPALRGADSAAKATACVATIRSLQTANARFAGDHDDRYAPGGAGMLRDNLRRWHGARPSANAPFTPEGGSLTPYLGAPGATLRACPAFADVARHLDERPAGFERGAGGYGYNNGFVGTLRESNAVGGFSVRDDQLGARMGLFRAPSRTIAFADAALAEASLVEYSFVEPRFWPNAAPSAGARADPSTHFRHLGAAAGPTASVVWLDGHATTERRTFTWSSGLYAADPGALGLGWTGEHDSNELFDYE